MSEKTSESAALRAGDKTIKVNIVSETKPIWKGTAYSAVILAVGGQMGVLPNHEPFILLLNAGEIKVYGQSGQTYRFNCESGFASFDTNSLTVAVADCSDNLDDVSEKE